MSEIFPRRIHDNGDIAIPNGAIKKAIKRNNKTADKPATGTTMESIKNLIDAIESGKSLNIDEAFHEVFSTKVTQKIAEMRNDISENLFAKSENLDELSKNTLGSYIKKANHSGGLADFRLGKYKDKSQAKISAKRERGISTAVAKLTKETPLVKESVITGTKLIKKYGDEPNRAEVRYNQEHEEYQVHHYKDGKHLGEGPVSYHGNDKEDAHDTAKHEASKRAKE